MTKDGLRVEPARGGLEQDLTRAGHEYLGPFVLYDGWRILGTFPSQEEADAALGQERAVTKGGPTAASFQETCANCGDTRSGHMGELCVSLEYPGSQSFKPGGGRLVLESAAPVKYDAEDSGCALIGNVVDSDPYFFVSLRSWDERREHLTARRFEGRRVRVTVETI